MEPKFVSISSIVATAKLNSTDFRGLWDKTAAFVWPNLFGEDDHVIIEEAEVISIETVSKA